MTLIEEDGCVSTTVASHIPGFERYGKGGDPFHRRPYPGLRPDVDLHPWTGYDAAIELAKGRSADIRSGEAFVYSDINFFLLGDIVKRITGQSLDTYLKARVFRPLA
jgi:CubicO group peptidase (beta-lactamase class C family)